MPYADYSGFDSTYFEGTSVSNPHAAGYGNYRQDLLPFTHYAQKIIDEWDARGVATGKILIVGCAYGFTVESLVDKGEDAYGMDLSTHAVNQADSATSVGGRIYQGDVTVKADIESVESSTGGGQFDLIVNECVFATQTDAEASSAATNMRDRAADTVVQRVWASDGSDLERDLSADWYNSKTMTEWRNHCDPNGQDVWISETAFQPGGS